MLATGELHPLLPKDTEVTTLSWFPDSSQLVGSWDANSSDAVGLWSLSILGGTPRLLNEEGWMASVSPDGSQIAFVKGTGFGDSGQEIWVMNANGSDARRLVVSINGGLVTSPVWSPDGRAIAYLETIFGVYVSKNVIKLLDVAQGVSREILSSPGLDMGLAWLPDGRLLYTMDDPMPRPVGANVFATRVDLSAGKTVGTPVRITNGDGYITQLSVTADGRRIVLNRYKSQMDVYVAEFSPKGPKLGTRGD